MIHQDLDSCINYNFAQIISTSRSWCSQNKLRYVIHKHTSSTKAGDKRTIKPLAYQRSLKYVSKIPFDVICTVDLYSYVHADASIQLNIVSVSVPLSFLGD